MPSCLSTPKSAPAELRQIGAGTYSHVFMTRHNNARSVDGSCVLKVLDMNPRSKRRTSPASLRSELLALVRMRGAAGVVQLIEAQVHLDGAMLVCSGLDRIIAAHPGLVRVNEALPPNSAAIFLEAANDDGRDLKWWLRSQTPSLKRIPVVTASGFQPVDEECARSYFAAIARSVLACHERGLAVLDIKAENFCVREPDAASAAPAEITLVDLGFATPVSSAAAAAGESAESAEEALRHEFLGSPFYLSPCLLQHRRGYHATKCDTWALGVVLFMILTGGERPFVAPDMPGLCRKIEALEFEVPPYVSAGAAALLRRILVADFRKRPSVAEILADPWLATAPATRPPTPIMEAPTVHAAPFEGQEAAVAPLRQDVSTAGIDGGSPPTQATSMEADVMVRGAAPTATPAATATKPRSKRHRNNPRRSRGADAHVDPTGWTRCGSECHVSGDSGALCV